MTHVQAPAPGVATASGQSPASGQPANAQASSQASVTNTGAIIGGAIAAAVALAMLALVTVCLVARRRRRSLQDRASSAYEPDPAKQGSAYKVCLDGCPATASLWAPLLVRSCCYEDAGYATGATTAWGLATDIDCRKSRSWHLNLCTSVSAIQHMFA